MLLISVALKVEAQPIIDLFKLKILNDKRYNIYVNDEIALIITGVGKINSAIATSYLSMLFKDQIKAYINIGIAGHKDLELGTIVLADKIEDANTKKAQFPSLLFDRDLDLNPDSDILTKSVITVDKSEDNYKKDYVYDMEAFGFFKAASKFTYIDLICTLKIISDNASSNFKELTEDRVKKLIEKNLDILQKLSFDLIKLSKKIEPINNELPAFLFEKFHFSEYEKHDLKKLYFKLSNLDENFSIKMEDFNKFENKKAFLTYLTSLYEKTKLVL